MRDNFISMSNKKQSNDSTFIYPRDSSFESLCISRIQIQKHRQHFGRLSPSLQNLRNPYSQTLPLKFPKNRILKGGKSNMLQESTQTIYKPSIRTSQTRNRHNIEVQLKKGIRITHKNNQTSQDNNINQRFNDSVIIDNIQNSATNSLNSSLEKPSKRLYHHLIAKQSTKDPILIGQTNQSLKLRGKKLYEENDKNKNYAEGMKSSLEWKVNKCFQKQKFNNIFSSIPQLNFKSVIQNQKDSLTQRNHRQKPKLSGQNLKPQTYLEMYNKKKVIWK